jgi:GNAT superfamily N-acetyltransferase
VPFLTSTLTSTPSPEFLALYGARKQSLPPAAEHVLTAVPAVRFAEACDDQGTLLAIARGAVVDDWLHLGSVEVVEQARRQGLARVVSVALARWALEEGAARAFLQVEQINEPAVRLYQSLGFGPHHTYATYNLPASA